MDRTAFYPEMEINAIMPRLAAADLELLADDVDQIQVLITGSDEAVQALKLTCEEGRLRLDQPAYGVAPRPMGMHWVQVMLRLPRAWKGIVDASTMTGDIRARGISGTDLQLETMTGSLDAAGVNAITMKAVTVSGSQRLSGIQAEALHLRTVSGGMEGTGIQARSLRVTAVSGSTTLQLDSDFDLLEANLVSGGLRVTAPVAEADASIRSISGRLLTSGVSIQKGGPVVSATTVTGHVELICGADSAL